VYHPEPQRAVYSTDWNRPLRASQATRHQSNAHRELLLSEEGRPAEQHARAAHGALYEAEVQIRRE